MATGKIEKITNDSGDGYCKMPDGTLIQWGKEAITAWVNWEKETKELYEKRYVELCDTKDIAAALFVKCLIEDVDCELKQAEEKMMKLAAAGYDMIYILDEQEWLKEKYTKKTRVD